VLRLCLGEGGAKAGRERGGATPWPAKVPTAQSIMDAWRGMASSVTARSICL